MSITVIQPALSGFDAIPAKRQVFFGFTRKDVDGNSWGSDAGFASYSKAGDQTGTFSINDRIFLGSDTAANYNIIGTITTAPAFGGGITTFRTSVTFQANVNGWTNNLTTNTNYRIEIQIFDQAGSIQLIDETFLYFPTEGGILKTDLSDIALFLLRKDDLQELEITIKYREIWDQDTTAGFTTSSAIQIILADVTKEESITAMGDWLPDTDSKKWLTRFDSGESNAYNISKKLYKNWANYIYVIIDKDFNARTAGAPFYIEEGYNINKVFQSTLVVVTAAKDGLGTTVRIYEHEIDSNTANNALVAIRLTIASGANKLEKMYLHNVEPPDEPIMVQWLNELGGFDQWIFSMIRHEATNIIKEGIRTEIFSWDQNHLKPDRKIKRIDSQLMQKIRVASEPLTLTQFEAIRYLFQSDDVKVFLKKDASKKTGVLIDPDTVTWDTTAGQFGLEFMIEFEANYDFFKEKEY